jgi:ribulose-phosphate 3-epimerase
MTEIIPALLVKDFSELQGALARVVNIARAVQIDICDGKFVSSITWPMNADDEVSAESILNEEEGLPFWDSLDFEFDLMVLNAHTQFEFFTRLGARRLIFHIEAEENKAAFKEFLEGLDMYVRENVEIGLALNTTTSIQELAPFISHIDFVQCMGIEHIGSQGQPFDERVLKQIRELRKLYPELIISVDGSVNEATAPQLVEAGASRLVVGSALLKSSDMRETMRALESL